MRETLQGVGNSPIVNDEGCDFFCIGEELLVDGGHDIWSLPAPVCGPVNMVDRLAFHGC